MRGASMILSFLLATSGCGNTAGGGFGIRRDLAGVGGCTDDTHCTAPTPRCNKDTSMCVPCLPLPDNCPKGQRCVASGDGYQCAATCAKDADCPAGGAGSSMVCCKGSCFDSTSDAQNCGACDKRCEVPANATAGCTGGTCGIGECKAGFLDCDKGAGNGCEVTAASDDKNCGACGMACTAGPHQTASCMAGKCDSACATGYQHCSANPQDGCEVDTRADVRNCGGCGKDCGAPANAAPACVAGACALASCDPGFGDCDKVVGSGCEADLESLLHCGACGNACGAPANATAGCNGGVCGIGDCHMLFGDCDGNGGNGCEKNLANDVNNCGQCFAQCSAPNGTPSCVNGSCAVAACNAGFGNCDQNPGNGCEANLSTDVRNCGACGNVCPVNQSCMAGVCKAGQFLHHDGRGHTWMDNIPTGTYTLQQAARACQEYVNQGLGGGDVCIQQGCGCGGNNLCTYNQNANPRYTWFYNNDTMSGQVTLNCCACAFTTWD